jgi:hypothetical protein
MSACCCGLTAILGKLITLPALPLVWWRMLLVVAMLALLPRVWRGLRALTGTLALAYAGIGALVALHWLTFWGRSSWPMHRSPPPASRWRLPSPR